MDAIGAIILLRSSAFVYVPSGGLALRFQLQFSRELRAKVKRRKRDGQCLQGNWVGTVLGIPAARFTLLQSYVTVTIPSMP